MPVSTITANLQQRQQQRAEEALADYKQLVASVADGTEDVDVETVEETLERARKTPKDLEADVAAIHQLDELKTLAAGEPEHKQRHAAIQAEIVQLVEDFKVLTQENEARLAELQRKRTSAADALQKATEAGAKVMGLTERSEEENRLKEKHSLLSQRVSMTPNRRGEDFTELQEVGKELEAAERNRLAAVIEGN